MYIAVCDDLPEELERVESLLNRWGASRGCSLRYRLFNSSVELLEAADGESFDLYLLDVVMPGTTGLAAAKELRARGSRAEIVFLTTSPGFAYESYAVHAMDYLLKPMSEELLFPVLDRLHFREQRPEESISVKSGASYFRLPLSGLVYVEVNGKHLYFNMSDGTQREVAGSLNRYEDILLSRPEFMRIHRSYIVNMLLVEEFSATAARTFTGKSLPVSRLLYPQLQRDYMKLLFEREGEVE